MLLPFAKRVQIVALSRMHGSREKRQRISFRRRSELTLNFCELGIQERDVKRGILDNQLAPPTRTAGLVGNLGEFGLALEVGARKCMKPRAHPRRSRVCGWLVKRTARGPPIHQLERSRFQ